MEHDSNNLRGNNIGMTQEERAVLQEAIEDIRDAYDNSRLYEEPIFLSDAEKAIHVYVDSLLAAKDARIAALEARQITPEMEAWFNKAKTAYDQAEEAMFLKRLMRLMDQALKGSTHE